MSIFAKLETEFRPNWTTVLVGWDGPGRFVGPVLSRKEIETYAIERLGASPGGAEEDLVVKLLALDLASETRQSIRAHLARLADLNESDLSREIRKWRLVLLEDLLQNVPDEPLQGLIAISDFWNEFDFPQDMPPGVRGGKNTINASDYFQDRTYPPLLDSHRAWVAAEKLALRNQEHE